MDRISKEEALHALTVLEKKLAEIRTVMAGMKSPQVSDFNDVDKMLVSMSIGFSATLKMLQYNILEGVKLSKEAKRWWDTDASE